MTTISALEAAELQALQDALDDEYKSHETYAQATDAPSSDHPTSDFTESRQKKA